MPTDLPDVISPEVREFAALGFAVLCAITPFLFVVAIYLLSVCGLMGWVFSTQ
jgi:hypothetical protein